MWSLKWPWLAICSGDMLQKCLHCSIVCWRVLHQQVCILSVPEQIFIFFQPSQSAQKYVLHSFDATCPTFRKACVQCETYSVHFEGLWAFFHTLSWWSCTSWASHASHSSTSVDRCGGKPTFHSCQSFQSSRAGTYDRTGGVESTELGEKENQLGRRLWSV